MEKKLYRVKSNAVIFGVCSGIAKYFNIDPTIVRIITVVLGLGYGAGAFAYVIAYFIIPEEPKEDKNSSKQEIEEAEKVE